METCLSVKYLIHDNNLIRQQAYRVTEIYYDRVGREVEGDAGVKSKNRFATWQICANYPSNLLKTKET